ncbi:MAG: hypothetical protein ACR2GZ_07185 [Solirubrobacteraceae bacterium]
MIIQPLLVLAVGVCAGVALVALLERIVPGAGRALRGWRGRRRSSPAPANDELHARAMMSELCPHGWWAQIMLFEHAELADEREPRSVPEPGRVKLEWTELRDESGTPAVMRQVWAPTIGGALEAMLADRRTDETLEQIEQGAVADGALWPDPD